MALRSIVTVKVFSFFFFFFWEGWAKGKFGKGKIFMMMGEGISGFNREKSKKISLKKRDWGGGVGFGGG